MKPNVRRYGPPAGLALLLYGVGLGITHDPVLAVFIAGAFAAFFALVSVPLIFWFKHEAQREDVEALREQVHRTEVAQKALERRYVKFAQWAKDVDDEHAAHHRGLADGLRFIETHLGLRHLRGIPRQDREGA